MRARWICLVLGAASVAAAAPPAWVPPARAKGVSILVGVGGAADSDGVRRDGGRVSDVDEDLATGFGLAGWWDNEISPHIRVGARLGWTQADGEDSDGAYHAADLGLSARLFFPRRRALPFVQLVGGVSYLSLDADDLEADGLGWHLLVGGGIELAASRGSSVVLAAAWLRQTATLDAELRGRDAEIRDLVLSRFVLSVGGGF